MSQNNNRDTTLDGLYIGLMVIAAFFLIYFFFGQQIAWVYVQIRKVWLVTLSSIIPQQSLADALRLVQTRRVSELNGEQLSFLSTSLRFYLFAFYGSIFAFVAYKSYKKNPARSYKRVLTRETLAKEMSTDFPWTLPALKKDLTKEPINKGKWAMALNPVQFSKRYNLLRGKEIDINDAEKIFAQQLGRLWTKPERLHPHTKALFACFAAQIMRDTDGAQEALKELVISYVSGKMSYKKSAELFKKYAHTKEVEEICNRHAYQSTVLIAMFYEGKQSGIFPPNHFLWLKQENRKLWLSLNCVLRRTSFPEVAGIFSHYQAETVSGHAIEMPQVKAAAVALKNAINEVAIEN